MNECWLCMGACDPTYHASSKRIRAWMLRRIVDASAPPVPVTPRTFAPRVSDVVGLGLGTVEQRKRASRLGGRGGRR
jgi:hypothetical protein